MYDDLRELYQQTIIEHSKHPRNRRQPDDFNREALGKNPTCGDALVVYLRLSAEGLVEDCAFVGEGCAISLASASMMTEIVKGKTEAEARRLIEAFHGIATGKD